jgi:hypothetical protein
LLHLGHWIFLALAGEVSFTLSEARHPGQLHGMVLLVAGTGRLRAVEGASLSASLRRTRCVLGATGADFFRAADEGAPSASARRTRMVLDGPAALAGSGDSEAAQGCGRKICPHPEHCMRVGRGPGTFFFWKHHGQSTTIEETALAGSRFAAAGSARKLLSHLGHTTFRGLAEDVSFTLREARHPGQVNKSMQRSLFATGERLNHWRL